MYHHFDNPMVRGWPHSKVKNKMLTKLTLSQYLISLNQLSQKKYITDSSQISQEHKASALSGSTKIPIW